MGTEPAIHDNLTLYIAIKTELQLERVRAVCIEFKFNNYNLKKQQKLATYEITYFLTA